MCDRGMVEFDSLVRAEVFELFCGEVRAVVGDDAVGYAEPEEDGSDEVDCGGGSRTCNWYGFDPLGEFVDSDQQVSMSAWR